MPTWGPQGACVNGSPRRKRLKAVDDSHEGLTSSSSTVGVPGVSQTSPKKQFKKRAESVGTTQPTATGTLKNGRKKRRSRGCVAKEMKERRAPARRAGRELGGVFTRNSQVGRGGRFFLHASANELSSSSHGAPCCAAILRPRIKQIFSDFYALGKPTYHPPTSTTFFHSGRLFQLIFFTCAHRIT